MLKINEGTIAVNTSATIFARQFVGRNNQWALRRMIVQHSGAMRYRLLLPTIYLMDKYTHPYHLIVR